MIKRFLVALFALALAGNAFAADVTPNLGLVKPPAIAGTWADDINDNFDKIDAAFTEDGLIDTFTQTEADSIDFLVGTPTGSLAAERVCTTTATIACDKATAGQIKWNVVGNSIGPTQIDETLDYVWTGKHTFTQLVLVPVTVAALPAAPSDGQLAIVSDASSASTCETGGGGFQNLCKRNSGTGHWEAIGTLSAANTLAGLTAIIRTDAVDPTTALEIGNGFQCWRLYADSSNVARMETCQASDWVARGTSAKQIIITDHLDVPLMQWDNDTGVLTRLVKGTEAQGDILYRNATGWVRLPAGTAGQCLKSGGAGANPAWAAC